MDTERSITLGVAAAAFESVHHTGDTVPAELIEVLGIEGVQASEKAWK
jgi:hypothetical protein